MQARSRDILAVGCASCGTVVDTADRNYKVLSRARQGEREQYVPRLPLGSKGVLEDKPVEVIGFLVRRCKVDGIAYTWREYLLAGEHGTYRWLTEYNGHWNIVDVLSRPRRRAALSKWTASGSAARCSSIFRPRRSPKSFR